VEGQRVTAILNAVETGDLRSVAMLLNQDPALVNAHNDRGDSAILLAAYHGHGAIQDLLQIRGAEMDVFAASAVGEFGRVREVLSEDPELAFAYSHDGFTALHLAAYFGHVEIVGLLLDRHADPNAIGQNQSLVRPLHSAVARSQQAAAELLLKRGADPNARQSGGVTPLHSAAQKGQDIIVRLLLAGGAQVDARTDDGKTALDVARDGGHEEVVHMLRQHGATG
jgi:ankyrin repeat protein